MTIQYHPSFIYTYPTSPIIVPQYNEEIEFDKISAIPHFEERIDRTHLSSHKIQEIVNPVLKKFFSKIHYTQLDLVCQYIDHYNETSHKFSNCITPLEALKSFTPDLEKSIKTTHGGHCYEFIKNIEKQLPSSLHCNIIPSSIPNKFAKKYSHKLSHIAAVIAYNNREDSPNEGFILLDPSFELRTCIVIPFQGNSEKVTSLGGRDFTFSHEGDKIIGRITSPEDSNEKELKITYFLKKVTNFPDIALRPLIAASRKILLSTYGTSPKTNSDLCVKLEKEVITWGKGSYWKPTITFNDFLNKKFQFDQSFSSNPYLDIGVINRSIEKILLHKELLKNLHLDYIKTLEKCCRKEEFLIDM